MGASWARGELKRTAKARQNRSVALRVHKKRCFNAVVGSGWFATEDKKSPVKLDLNSPISLVLWVTRFNCAGVPSAV